MILYRVICWIKGEHNFEREELVDNNTTKCYCKCGKFARVNWRYVGGYKNGVSRINNIKRKLELNTNHYK